MSFLKYFGITKERKKKREGIPVYHKYKGQTRESYQKNIENLRDYNDKQKAKEIDKELRKIHHGKISNKEY